MLQFYNYLAFKYQFLLHKLLGVNLDPGLGHLRFNASNVITHGMTSVDLLGYLLACNICGVVCISVFVWTCGPGARCVCRLHTMSPSFGEQRSASGWAFPGVSYRHPKAPLSSPPLPSPLLPSLLIWLGHCLPVPVIAFACCCVFKNSLGPHSPPLLISQLPQGALGITSRHDNATHVVELRCTHWLCIFCPGWFYFIVINHFNHIAYK